MVTGFSTMKTACSLATTHIAHSQELLRKRRRCWSLPDILFDVRFRYISFMAVAVRNNIEEQKSKIKKKKCRFWSRVGMGWIISGIHTHAPPPPILAHTHASLCTQNGRTVLYSRSAWEWDCVWRRERKSVFYCCLCIRNGICGMAKYLHGAIATHPKNRCYCVSRRATLPSQPINISPAV